MDENKPPNQEIVKAVVEQKRQKIDSVVAERIGKLTARRESYRRIRDLVKRDVSEYYDRYPERALDDRARDDEDYLVRGLRNIFIILDDYMISFRSEDDPKPLTSEHPVIDISSKGEKSA